VLRVFAGAHSTAAVTITERAKMENRFTPAVPSFSGIKDTHGATLKQIIPALEANEERRMYG